MNRDYDLYFEERIGQLSFGWGYVTETNTYYKLVKVGDLEEETEFDIVTVPFDVCEIFLSMRNMTEDD